MSDLTLRRWRGHLTRALIVENPDPSLDDHLRALGIEPQRLAEPPDEDELVRILREGQHHLIYKRSRVEVTERVVQASDQLAAVMLCCIGDDSVDKQACARHGVMVMNDPVSNGRSVAELVIGEIIALSRRVLDASIEMQTSTWRKNNVQRYEVKGKRLGVLGMGRIGRQVAQLAELMGMQVYFFDSNSVAVEIGETLGWTPCGSIEELFAAADVVTVHVSAEDAQGRSNQGLLTYAHFRAMGQRGADSPRLFLNLARGFILDPEDLKRACAEGHVSYAMTDVFPSEPSRASPQAWVNPFADAPRIYATPHIGAATREAQPRIARYVARTTRMFSWQGAVRNCVFRPKVNISVDEAVSEHLLVVAHADTRGTKKAVDDAIYRAGANNLQSAHYDMPGYGIAYEVAALDRELTAEQLDALVERAATLTGDPNAIRWIRTIERGKLPSA